MMQRLRFLFICLVLAAAAPHAQDPERQGFKRLAIARGLGALLASVSAVGSDGRERVYLSYIYGDNTLEVLAVDAQDGSAERYVNPARGEFGAWAIAKA